jgi:SAM-dependent methyltransferase
VTADWWQTFFDADYARIWDAGTRAEVTTSHAEGLWRLLRLGPETRVLDAPCGYGRLSRPLAQRGAVVVGVDQSRPLLEQAERDRGNLPPERLRYLRHDLRQPLPCGGFDAAFNVWSSLGYGSGADDLAILSTIHAALRPGGLVFVELLPRDAVVATLARGIRPSNRLADGTLVLEDPRLDPLSGRLDIRWAWSGPSGSGEKVGSLRLYGAWELVALVERAGFQVRSAHNGCSPAPFDGDGLGADARLGLLAQKH